MATKYYEQPPETELDIRPLPWFGKGKQVAPNWFLKIDELFLSSASGVTAISGSDKYFPLAGIEFTMSSSDPNRIRVTGSSFNADMNFSNVRLLVPYETALIPLINEFAKRGPVKQVIIYKTVKDNQIAFEISMTNVTIESIRTRLDLDLIEIEVSPQQIETKEVVFKQDGTPAGNNIGKVNLETLKFNPS